MLIGTILRFRPLSGIMFLHCPRRRLPYPARQCRVSVPCRGLCFFTVGAKPHNTQESKAWFPSPVGDYLSSRVHDDDFEAWVYQSFRPLSGIMFLHSEKSIRDITKAVVIMFPSPVGDYVSSLYLRGECIMLSKIGVVSVPCRGLCFFTKNR